MTNPFLIIRNLKLRPNLHVSHNYEAVTAFIDGILLMYSEYLREKNTVYQFPNFINKEIKDWYAPNEALTLKELVKLKYKDISDEQLTIIYIDNILKFFETEGLKYRELGEENK